MLRRHPIPLLVKPLDARMLSLGGSATTILMLAIKICRGRLVKKKALSFTNYSVGSLRSLCWIRVLKGGDLGLKIGYDVVSKSVDRALHLSELVLTEVFVLCEASPPGLSGSEVTPGESIEEIDSGIDKDVALIVCHLRSWSVHFSLKCLDDDSYLGSDDEIELAVRI